MSKRVHKKSHLLFVENTVLVTHCWKNVYLWLFSVYVDVQCVILFNKPY